MAAENPPTLKNQPSGGGVLGELVTHTGDADLNAFEQMMDENDLTYDRLRTELKVDRTLRRKTRMAQVHVSLDSANALYSESPAHEPPATRTDTVKRPLR